MHRSTGAGLVRLTPACAGSTFLVHLLDHLPSTYPRVCGEHGPTDTDTAGKADLPPRVRGARLAAAAPAALDRLTPACAGSTPLTRWRGR